jgi:membrane-bound ClpP family serine protease
MESLDKLSDYERKNFFLAIGMFILGVITILSYVYSGSSAVFVFFAIITIIVGLYMAIRISNEENVLNQRKTSKNK